MSANSDNEQSFYDGARRTTENKYAAAPSLITVDEISVLATAAVDSIARASTLEELKKLKVLYLGKQSEISRLLKGLGHISDEDRRRYGPVVHAAKSKVDSKYSEREEELAKFPKRSQSAIDVTLPGIRRGIGRRHPLMQTIEDVKLVMLGMGFRYDDYPEIETEFYNFEALNTPEWHPSRDSDASFFTKSGNVLRTHTSAFQVRAMRRFKHPPIRAMTSGRCYRRDEIDATHFPVFNQLDAIAIDRGITFANLKWTLDRMLRLILGPEIELRFRPSYFPFTTPSAEVDVFYRGQWMELLGSGMIRPEVLRHGGLDPEVYQGFAYGMGIDRLTMARYRIDDIRFLYANEEAFLAQF